VSGQAAAGYIPVTLVWKSKEIKKLKGERLIFALRFIRTIVHNASWLSINLLILPLICYETWTAAQSFDHDLMLLYKSHHCIWMLCMPRMREMPSSSKRGARFCGKEHAWWSWAL